MSITLRGCRSASNTAVAATLLALAALSASACGGGDSSPVTNGPSGNLSNFVGAFSSSNYAPTTLNVGLTATGSGSTQTVTGSYSTQNGITGGIQGTLTGSLASGTFQGTLSYNTSPLGGTNCNGVGTFSGTVSSTAGIDWTSSGFSSSCAGDPKAVHTVATPGGSGPVTAPSVAAVNVTGTWGQGGQGLLSLTQSGNTVTGSEIVPPTPGLVFNSQVIGLVTGNTFTATLGISFTFTVSGEAPITCSGFVQTINAQISGSTMSGTITNGTSFTCNGGIGTFPLPDAGVPQAFVLTKL